MSKALLDTDWMDDAACVGMDPDLFFPGRLDSNGREAKAVCGMCPVRELCLEYALTNREIFGVWGGASERERRRMRNARRQGAA